jgi:hypothetical protein
MTLKLIPAPSIPKSPKLTRRGRFEIGLSGMYLPVYRQLCRVLPDDWQPYQGFRNFEEQQDLYDRQDGTTKAPGGCSPHNYGCASDWTIFVEGRPVWLKPDDPRWGVYQDAIAMAGGKWGADWNRNGVTSDESWRDWFHNELPIAVKWSTVLTVYKRGGMEAAMRYIAQNAS